MLTSDSAIHEYGFKILRHWCVNGSINPVYLSILDKYKDQLSATFGVEEYNDLIQTLQGRIGINNDNNAISNVDPEEFKLFVELLCAGNHDEHREFLTDLFLRKAGQFNILEVPFSPIFEDTDSIENITMESEAILLSLALSPEMEFYRALESNNLEATNRLIDGGIDLNKPVPGKSLPLNFYVSKIAAPNFAIIYKMLEAGAKFFPSSSKQETLKLVNQCLAEKLYKKSITTVEKEARLEELPESIASLKEIVAMRALEYHELTGLNYQPQSNIETQEEPVAPTPQVSNAPSLTNLGVTLDLIKNACEKLTILNGLENKLEKLNQQVGKLGETIAHLNELISSFNKENKKDNESFDRIIKIDDDDNVDKTVVVIREGNNGDAENVEQNNESPATAPRSPRFFPASVNNNNNNNNNNNENNNHRLKREHSAILSNEEKEAGEKKDVEEPQEKAPRRQ